mmetsp:Transcript_18881/g.27975  ORF Transcript_18881/g.27975 Transcript_18881/m.27975 type:complete len:466 (-) Transcript_18881:194-1591(-)
MNKNTNTNTNTNTNAKPEWDRLLSAAQKNNAELIHSLITIDKVSPSHANAVGQSALHIACLWGNISAVQALLSHGADTKAQNRITGASPLHSCIQSSKEPFLNRVTCAQLLIDQDQATASGNGGADVHLTDLYGSTAMDSLQEEIERSQSLPQDYIEQMMQVLEAGDKRVLNLIPLVLEQDLQGLQALLDNIHVGIGAIDKDDCEREREREHNIGVGDSSGRVDVGMDVDVDMDERDPKTGKTALLLATEQITNTNHSLKETSPSLFTKEQEQEQMEHLSNIIQLLLQKGCDPNSIPNKNIDDTVLPDTMSPFYMICKALDAEHIKRLNDDNHDDSNANANANDDRDNVYYLDPYYPTTNNNNDDEEGNGNGNGNEVTSGNGSGSGGKCEGSHDEGNDNESKPQQQQQPTKYSTPFVTAPKCDKSNPSRMQYSTPFVKAPPQHEESELENICSNAGTEEFNESLL